MKTTLRILSPLALVAKALVCWRRSRNERRIRYARAREAARLMVIGGTLSAPKPRR